MSLSEAAQFVYEHALPQSVDIEAAKAAILDYMKDQPRVPATRTDGLIAQVRARLAATPGPVPPGYLSVEPDLNALRTELAIHEAIQQLHGQGVLIAHGQFRTSGGLGERTVVGASTFSRGGIPGVSIPVPELQQGYTLATTFLGQHYLLADADLYLAQLQSDHLPSRARRCLREAISSFRHGDYLSASTNVGAASESLWMRLGRVVQSKHLPGGTKLSQELGKPYLSAAAVLESTWDVLTRACEGQLKAILPTRGEREAFKQHADTLRDRRNYAIHDEDADEDEALFRYNETALLLLNAVKYFNQLMALIQAVQEMPANE